MDEYPAFSLDHSIPLLVTLGITPPSPYESSIDLYLKDDAIVLKSDIPAVDSEHAKAFLRYFQENDASGLAWNGRQTKKSYKFRVRAAERTLLLPPRQATLPENFEPPETTPVVMHSPYSPLSPISSLYPDGLIDARWVQKHQDLIPSVLVCFHSLTSDPNQATLDDNKIKTDVNNIRTLLSQSGCRTRLVVILLSDKVTSSVEGIQERLENIRRGGGIEQKALFLVPPQESQDALEHLADSTLSAMYGLSLEYYRDMGRHARKKRGRGIAPQPTVPPTIGTSQTLSLAGWNVRYDFKSALFAEFRQEMDTAYRSYEQAYEALLGPELLEVIPSWSPRWNEARLLADILAVRSLRCLLWNGQYSSAVRRWQSHRDRICDFIDRRGRGTNNYGWAAWEARWAEVMAQLIQKADIAELVSATPSLFLQPERGVLGERLQPWELLHHPGYWHHLASRYHYKRRTLAQAMPEDDRRSPSDSPASQVASKAFTYDTYMCPDPHEEYPLRHRGIDHSSLIVDSLLRARAEFLKRKQLRFGLEIAVECARELANAQDWEHAVELLHPLWNDPFFRAEGWIDINEELSWTLRRAASKTGKAKLVVAIDWALLHRTFTRHSNWHYDISRSLEGITLDAKPTVKTGDGPSPSFIIPSFAFKKDEGKAGQTASAQLSLTSRAQEGSAPIVLDSLQVQFEGAVKTIVLHHDPGAGSSERKAGKTILSTVALKETAAEEPDPSMPEADEGDPIRSLDGTAHLVLLPGHTVVFEMEVPLREPGEATALQLQLSLHTEAFDLEHVAVLGSPGAPPTLWHTSAALKKRVARANPLSIRVLPRPPKMEIKAFKLLDQYYTNEHLELQFEIHNAEDVDASVKLDAVLRGSNPPPDFALDIGDGNDPHPSTSEDDEARVLGASMGRLDPSQSTTVSVRVQPTDRSTRYDLTLRAAYHLSTDPATLITQVTMFQVNIFSPFEANYDLLPRLHPDPWPSLFDHDTVVDTSSEEKAAPAAPAGLSQAWSLVTRYASFASQDLMVLDLDLAIHRSQTVRCVVAKESTVPAAGRQVSPKTIEEASFHISAQKTSLDDRGVSSLEAALQIRWARLDAAPEAPVNVTTLPVPRLNLFGTEPRVLATASYVTAPDPVGPEDSQQEEEDPGAAGASRRGEKLLVLDVVLENASNHFLTFGLTMEPSDEFAFSGSKQTTLNLLPVSRRSVTYRLLPLETGVWIKPGLVVRDKYFQKVLRVIPTEGMKLDKDGFLVWVPPDEDEDEDDEAEEEEEDGSKAGGGETEA